MMIHGDIIKKKEEEEMQNMSVCNMYLRSNTGESREIHNKCVKNACVYVRYYDERGTSLTMHRCKNHVMGGRDNIMCNSEFKSTRLRIRFAKSKPSK